MEDLTAGMIAGQAPMFERFVLGNSAMLRGWSKYDLDPLGGNRMIHNTVEYQVRRLPGVLRLGCDLGWRPGGRGPNSAGIGLRHGAFSASIAFPLRDGTSIRFLCWA